MANVPSLLLIKSRIARSWLLPSWDDDFAGVGMGDDMDADEAKVEVARRCRALAPLMERHCGQGSSAGLLLTAAALDA